MISAHAETVGSLLRPPELLQARRAFVAGSLSAEGLRAEEDRAVDAAICLQREAGLEIITDGEMRRLSFQSQMTEAVEGFGQVGLEAFVWGDWQGSDEVGSWRAPRPAGLGVVGRLRRRRSLSAAEFLYLRQRLAGTALVPKITLPSPSLWANFWSPERSTSVYPTLESFLADVVDILRQEVMELARLGARYLQLDAPHYPLLLDPRTRPFYEERGWSVERWLRQGIELDNAVLDAAAGVTFGFHL